MNDPSSPVVLITGAARRIGAAIARRLHAAGCRLALHYRDSQTDAVALAAELQVQGREPVLLLQGDLALVDTPQRLVAATLAQFGRIDGLVNNASVFFATPLATATPAQWDALFAVNARAPFFLAQAAAQSLRAQRGAIVNLGDIYADRPRTDLPAYAASKSALQAITRSLALTMAPLVRVNAIAPGAILWPEIDSSPSAQATMLARTPLDRIGTPEDVAEAVHWLLYGANFMTGQTLVLDGGRTLSS